MVNKICFLLLTPMTKRDYKRFGVDVLHNRGYEVLFFDLTEMVNPEYNIKYRPPDLYVNEKIIHFKSQAELEKYLKDNKEGMLVIDLVLGNVTEYYIYRLMKKYNISYARFAASTYPDNLYVGDNAHSKIRLNILIKKIWERLRAGHIYNKIINRLHGLFLSKVYPSKLGKLQSPKYVFLGGAAGVKHFNMMPRGNKSTKNIWIHTLDYDLYLEYKSTKPAPLIKHEYAAFLDEYFPFHPDFNRKNCLKNPCNNPLDYYRELNLLLDQLELKLQCPIVIAAHPRSHYEKKQDVFGGRKIIRGKTVELVAKAKCVLAHASTALNYAVMFERPALLLMLIQMKGSYYEWSIRGIAQALGKEPIDLKNIEKFDLNNQLLIDNKKYSIYKENHIKRKGTPEKYFWDIVADHIMSDAE